jgi:predicted mannosyl-3-phosphoglycerate phosphatase (HAD superfamily)
MAKSRRKKTRRKKRKAKGLTQQEKEKINSTLKNRNLKTISLSSKYHELPSELQKKIELQVKSYLQEKKKKEKQLLLKSPIYVPGQDVLDAEKEAKLAREKAKESREKLEKLKEKLEKLKEKNRLRKLRKEQREAQE